MCCYLINNKHTGLTAVHIAAREAFVDVLRFLFEMGADKNSPVCLCVCACVSLCDILFAYRIPVVAALHYTMLLKHNTFLL